MNPGAHAEPGLENRRLQQLDREHVWHPFTPMRQWREGNPLVIAAGEGDFLIDVEGKRYIDGVSSLWCNVHGHRVAEIDAAIRGQLGKIAHTTMLGLASEPSIELARRLVDIVPGGSRGAKGRLRKVFFSDSGATSTELAFKMAIGYHYHNGRPQRTTILAFSGAYHGDTVGAMSVGYSDVFHRPFHALTFRTIHAPGPDITNSPEAREYFARGGAGWPGRERELARRVRERCLGELDRILMEHRESIAAICIEPLVQGAAGIVVQPTGFLAGVAERARRLEIPLICDEVATGFARTGRMFACEHEGVEPDILCLAKGISGGYLPLAATLATDEIESAFQGEPWEHRTLYHGHTYTGNPLACAAGLASLDLFQKNSVIANAQANGDLMRGWLDKLAGHPNVLDVRQCGLMAGIELCAQRPPKGPVRLLPPERRIGHEVCAACRAKGLIIRPLGNTVVLMPMPGMKRPTLERMMAIVVETIGEFEFPA